VTYALVQCVRVARRNLRLEHELAVLDSFDTHHHPERGTDGIWLGLRDDHEPPPIYPIPSAAPTAPGPAPTTTTPTTTTPRSALTDHHLVHDNHYPNPGRSTDGTWLGSDDNYPDDNYPDDNYPGALSPITTPSTTSPTTNTTPIPGAAPTAPGPTTPATAHPSAKGDPTTNFRKTKNRIQRTEVDGEM
jgi:hypothetical protein